MARWRPGWISDALALFGVAVIIGTVGAGIWVAFGGYDVSASKPHDALSYPAIHMVAVRTIETRSADVPDPPPFTPDRVVAGFRQYDAECVRCHGAPGAAREVWADWMNPSPPYLLDVARRYSNRQLFWVVCHGIKMTGMPAWGTHRSDDDIWNLVAFLRTLPATSPADYAQLRTANPAGDPSGQPGMPDGKCLTQP